MDEPRVGGVWLRDWCTCQPTYRALKTRSCSRLQPWMVHAWEVFDSYICGPTCRALKTRSRSGLNFFPKEKTNWCYYPHWSRDSVSPVCVFFFILCFNFKLSYVGVDYSACFLPIDSHCVSAVTPPPHGSIVSSLLWLGVDSGTILYYYNTLLYYTITYYTILYFSILYCR